jgi:hypothetical protein
VPGKSSLTQRQQNKGTDRGLQEQQREHAPIHIDGTAVEKVESFKFLGVHITDKIEWSTHKDSASSTSGG